MLSKLFVRSFNLPEKRGLFISSLFRLRGGDGRRKPAADPSRRIKDGMASGIAARLDADPPRAYRMLIRRLTFEKNVPDIRNTKPRSPTRYKRGRRRAAASTS